MQKENIENLAEMWKAPVLLVCINGGNRVEGKQFHLSDQLKKAQLELLADENTKITPAFFSLESWDLVELFGYCRPKYEPILIITDSDKKSEFVLQLYFEEGETLEVLPTLLRVSVRAYVCPEDLARRCMQGLRTRTAGVAVPAFGPPVRVPATADGGPERCDSFTLFGSL